MNSFPEILLKRVEQSPDAIAYRFIHGAALHADELSYGNLWRRATGVALELQSRYPKGSRLLLVCKLQHDFVISFFGALIAGMVLVPTAMPRRQLLWNRLTLLAQDAQVSAILTDVSDIGDTTVIVNGTPLEVINLSACVDTDDSYVGYASGMPALDAAQPALLQYTSGSTGAPKGVVITHDNLFYNSSVIQTAMRISSSSCVFTALPMFHDMGLVGGLLQPMFSGCVGNFMTPAEFVQFPERWLQSISKFGVTVSGGPDYMYGLAARAISDTDLAGVDLSSWQLAFCGAEPIRLDTVRAFTRRFAPLGFRASAFYPCYGMAESTLFISGKGDDEVAQVARTESGDVISCGSPYGDTEIKIVDPATRQELQDEQSGEIWVRGRSTAAAYWNRPELSSSIFQARILGGDERSFLRTGDLGFLRHGQLFVTGRWKDLIIVYGKKYAPQDLEVEAERSHPAMCHAGAAAFMSPGPQGEQIVLVGEIERAWLRRESEWPTVTAAVRAAVQHAHGLTVHEVILIKPGSLPRTSSGKVMRTQCRTEFIGGKYQQSIAS